MNWPQVYCRSTVLIINMYKTPHSILYTTDHRFLWRYSTLLACLWLTICLTSALSSQPKRFPSEFHILVTLIDCIEVSILIDSEMDEKLPKLAVNDRKSPASANHTATHFDRMSILSATWLDQKLVLETLEAVCRDGGGGGGAGSVDLHAFVRRLSVRSAFFETCSPFVWSQFWKQRKRKLSSSPEWLTDWITRRRSLSRLSIWRFLTMQCYPVRVMKKNSSCFWWQAFFAFSCRSPHSPQSVCCSALPLNLGFLFCSGQETFALPLSKLFPIAAMRVRSVEGILKVPSK